MTINDVQSKSTIWFQCLYPLYLAWSWQTPGSDKEEALAQSLAVMAEIYFINDVRAKKEFLLSLETYDTGYISYA